MRKAERQIEGGDVILLHDGCNVAMGYDRSQSVQATELILDRWKEREGFEFVTVPEMIEPTGFVVPLMRIFIWHGYLLGGTGSNIFARELAREWGLAGHDVTVFSQDPAPERFDLGGAATVRPDVGGLLPVFVIDRYEGYRGEAGAGLLARGARPLGRGERRRDPGARAGRPRVRQPRDARRRRRRGERQRVRRQGPRLRARVLDARQPGAVGVGRGRARERVGDDRRLRAHPRRRRGGLRAGRRRPRDPAGRRRRALAPRAARAGARAAARRVAPRRPEPGQRRGAAARRAATRSGSPRSWPATARPSSTSAS